MLATFRWPVPPRAMKALSLDPYNLHTVSRFPGSSLSLSQKSISAARTLQNSNHPKDAKVEERVIIKLLSSQFFQTKITGKDIFHSCGTNSEMS
jgi:hypothetical protein